MVAPLRRSCAYAVGSGFSLFGWGGVHSAVARGRCCERGQPSCKYKTMVGCCYWCSRDVTPLWSCEARRPFCCAGCRPIPPMPEIFRCSLRLDGVTARVRRRSETPTFYVKKSRDFALSQRKHAPPPPRPSVYTFTLLLHSRETFLVERNGALLYLIVVLIVLFTRIHGRFLFLSVFNYSGKSLVTVLCFSRDAPCYDTLAPFTPFHIFRRLL